MSGLTKSESILFFKTIKKDVARVLEMLQERHTQETALMREALEFARDHSENKLEVARRARAALAPIEGET